MISLDYSFCDRKDCPSSITCDRFLTPRQLPKDGSTKPLSYSNFKPDKSNQCEFYIATFPNRIIC